jgi:hypothetical protein
MPLREGNLVKHKSGGQIMVVDWAPTNSARFQSAKTIFQVVIAVLGYIAGEHQPA